MITRDYEIKNFTAMNANTVSNIHYTQAIDGKFSKYPTGQFLSTWYRFR